MEKIKTSDKLKLWCNVFGYDILEGDMAAYIKEVMELERLGQSENTYSEEQMIDFASIFRSDSEWNLVRDEDPNAKINKTYYTTKSLLNRFKKLPSETAPKTDETVKSTVPKTDVKKAKEFNHQRLAKLLAVSSAIINFYFIYRYGNEYNNYTVFGLVFFAFSFLYLGLTEKK